MLFICFFLDDLQVENVNQGCPKCILGIHLSPANKNFFLTISFLLYLVLTCLILLKQKEKLLKEFYLKLLVVYANGVASSKRQNTKFVIL